MYGAMVSTTKVYNAKIDIIGLKDTLAPISSIGFILGLHTTNECLFCLRIEINAFHVCTHLVLQHILVQNKVICSTCCIHVCIWACFGHIKYKQISVSIHGYWICVSHIFRDLDYVIEKDSPYNHVHTPVNHFGTWALGFSFSNIHIICIASWQIKTMWRISIKIIHIILKCPRSPLWAPRYQMKVSNLCANSISWTIIYEPFNQCYQIVLPIS